MALTLSTAVRDAIANAVDDYINTGTAQTIEFQTAGSVEVATITLNTTNAFGASSTGTITMTGQPLSDSSATGNASDVTKFVIKVDAADAITGTVNTTGADINFPGGVVFGVGDTVTLTTFTITCPAS
jgi:hypothetical protein